MRRGGGGGGGGRGGGGGGAGGGEPVECPQEPAAVADRRVVAVPRRVRGRQEELVGVMPDGVGGDRLEVAAASAAGGSPVAVDAGHRPQEGQRAGRLAAPALAASRGGEV